MEVSEKKLLFLQRSKAFFLITEFGKIGVNSPVDGRWSGRLRSVFKHSNDYSVECFIKAFALHTVNISGGYIQI